MNQNLAPIVHNLDRQYREPQPLALFELAELMRVHLGDSDEAFDALVTRAWDARNTLDAVIGELASGISPKGLLDTDPTDLATLIRAAAHDSATQVTDSVGYAGWRRADDALRAQLDNELKAALPPFADAVVAKLRPAFNKHAAVITKAGKVGITRETDPTALVNSGTAEQIEAFRALPAAVAALEQIKGLRDSLTITLNYGPRSLLGLAYVAPTTDLQTAVNRYAPELEPAQYNLPTHGATIVTVEANRVGGRWLHLVDGGFTLRLNTATEVEDMIAAARKAA